MMATFGNTSEYAAAGNYAYREVQTFYGLAQRIDRLEREQA